MKRLLLAAAQGDADARFNPGVMSDNRIDDHGNAVRPRDDNGHDIDSLRARQDLAAQSAERRGPEGGENPRECRS